MGDSGDMAREMERVCEALDSAKRLAAGLDQLRSALDRHPDVRYSPARSLIEQGAVSAARVMHYLRAHAQQP